MSAGIAIALFGALSAWLLQWGEKLLDRNRRRQSTLVALASEVQSIADLIKSDRYLERFHQLAGTVRDGTWTGESYVIDIRSNYTRVFEANAGNLSDLKPAQVSKIVSFYAYGQALIDGTKPDGSAVNSEHQSDRAENIVAIEGLLMAMLALADEIVAMPKKPLPVLAQ